MEKKLQHCAIYIRVSTAEQAMHGKSLQAQQECLEQYAKEHNMIITGIYADRGETARKELRKRKAIHELLKEVKQNKIDVILFWKMDRWFRNVSDFYKVQDILNAHKTTWIAVAEPQMNMETRDGRLNLNIMLSIGQNEVDTTSERIKFTVNNMIENGRLVWGENNIGFGYKIENGKIVKDSETAHMVDVCYQHLIAHKCKNATVKYMRDTFHIDFTYAMLRTMVSSEFYIGKYRSNSNYCPAYLTETQWQTIQEINQKNIKYAHSGRIYYFSGMIRCPKCGKILVGAGCSSIINRKTLEKRIYCYYRCNKAFKYECNYKHRFSQNLLEKYLLENLQLEFTRFQSCRGSIEQPKKQKTKKRSKSAITGEMNRLNTLFQKGRVNFEYYNAEYEKLEKELQELNIIQMPKEDYSHIEKFLQQDFENVYHALSEENKRAFWHEMIANIIIEGSEVKGIIFRPNILY